MRRPGCSVIARQTGVVVAAVLLAAGAGSRFGGPDPKLRTTLRGRPLLSHAIDAVVESGLEVFVVTGAVDVDDLLPEAVTVVHNPHWAEGQAVSVRAGIAAAEAAGHDAVVVGLGDQPFVTADAWRSLAAERGDLVVATYDGRRGNPVRLGAAVWSLLPPAGDEVGRAVMAHFPNLVREIPCTGTSVDIDTLEDLRRWS